MMRHRRTHPYPFGNVVPDIVEYDPRAAEFDDVDYRDVFAELTMRPDPEEPTRPFGEYGR